MDKILRDKKAIFVFIAPALIMFLLVLIIPTIQMVYYSLCDYAALTPPESEHHWFPDGRHIPYVLEECRYSVINTE